MNKVDLEARKLRAWYSHRQGLDGRLAGATAAEVLEQTGWIRSVGGSTPYLALFARAGISRTSADEAVASLKIHELPAARGCTYVLPRSDFALGLKACQLMPDAEMRTASQLGVTEREIAKLCDAVRRAIEKEALDPEQIRQVVGPAARGLGEAGKKKGLTTTLPLALGKLQAAGDIRRVPVDGRLDQQRFRYAAWKPNPLAQCKFTQQEVCTELARHYFLWIGPAALTEFQAFAGVTMKAAKAAAAALELVPAEEGTGHLLLPGDVQEFRAFEAPAEPRYVLTGSLDGIALFRRGLNALVEPADVSHPLLGGKAGAPGDLPRHAIFDRGRLVGLWDYDPETKRIVWAAFVKKNRTLEQAVTRTEAFVREELGDARSFSLDSPQKRQARIQALARAAAG